MTKQLSSELVAFRDLIADLVRIPGVHGHEEPMIAATRDRFAESADNVEVDRRGNVYATFEPDGAVDQTLMLAAHMDVIGLVVKYIDADGFIRFDGNALSDAMSSRRVCLHGTRGDVLGVTSCRIGYGVTPAAERAKAPELKKMYIDIGCDSRAEVEALGIRVGDPISYGGRLETLNNPFRVVSPGLDDRAGMAVLFTLAQRMADIRPRPRVVLVGTVEEEVGTRGAVVATKRLMPDVAVSVDTQPAGGTPDVPEDLLPLQIAKGPVIKVHESRFIKAVHPRVRALLVESAEKAGVAYQLAGAPPAGSDMGVMQDAGAQVAAGALAIPRRYAHAPNEVIDLRDAFGAVGILQETVRICGTGFSLDRVPSA